MFHGFPVYERPDLGVPILFDGHRVYVRDLRWLTRLVRYSGTCRRCGESVTSLPRHALACAELGVAG